jgi:hypothetical protein
MANTPVLAKPFERRAEGAALLDLQLRERATQRGRVLTSSVGLGPPFPGGSPWVPWWGVPRGHPPHQETYDLNA